MPRLQRFGQLLPRVLIYLTFALVNWLALEIRADDLLPLDPPNPSASLSAQLQAEQALCMDAFPMPIHSLRLPYALYLPIYFDGSTRDPASASDQRAQRLPKLEHSIVPLGDLLDDVGQYYSQAASSFSSSVQIANDTQVSQPFSMTLYGDTGFVARDLASCQIEPQAEYALSVQNGELTFRNARTGDALPNVCAPTGPEDDLHGIYHAQIATQAPDAIRVHVDTAINSASSMISYVADSRYEAIANSELSHEAHIPAVLATRDALNWWDTEIVVQNVSAGDIALTFRVCSDSGACFQNNRAVLSAHERRSFLASHLLYENSGGFLIEHKGWYAVTATAQAAQAELPPPQIAVASHIFRQPVAQGQARPSAEQGSQCLLSMNHDHGKVDQLYAVTASASTLIRIFNPTSSYNTFTLQFLDSDNTIIASLRRVLLPRSTVNWTLADLLGSSDYQGDEALMNKRLRLSAGTSINIQAEGKVAASVWQDGQMVEALAPAAGATRWFAPFIGFPVVDFRWDDESRGVAGQPGARFGLGETFAAAHDQRPDWARAMNWYTWSRNRALCNQPVGDDAAYSTYIPMWWGLGGCSGDPADRSCVNSEERLRTIRNDLPSNCAGRPLFLANEPDLPWQGYMTYHELGRLVYVLRDWAGQLFSPAFASYRYDEPNRIFEEDAWCIDSYLHSCPGDARCSRCVRDGVDDGRDDPHDISLQGLELYFAERDRWAQNQSWRFDESVEGINLHFYTDVASIAAAEHWRAPYLQQYRDRADQAGWPIIVKEYGFITWRNQFGDPNNISPCEIAYYLDNVRRVLQRNLGNYDAAHNRNPFKLFWFHAGCIPGALAEYDTVCLFDPVQPALLSTPVGTCWYNDAAAQGDDDSLCACSQTFMPLAPTDVVR